MEKKERKREKWDWDCELEKGNEKTWIIKRLRTVKHRHRQKDTLYKQQQIWLLVVGPTLQLFLDSGDFLFSWLSPKIMQEIPKLCRKSQIVCTNFQSRNQKVCVDVSVCLCVHWPGMCLSKNQVRGGEFFSVIYLKRAPVMSHAATNCQRNNGGTFEEDTSPHQSFVKRATSEFCKTTLPLWRRCRFLQKSKLKKSNFTIQTWIHFNCAIFVHRYWGDSRPHQLSKRNFEYVSTFTVWSLCTDIVGTRVNTGWRGLTGSPTLHIIFHKRAIKYRSFLRKMTYKDKGSCESSPPCTIVNINIRVKYVFAFTVRSLCAAEIEANQVNTIVKKNSWSSNISQYHWYCLTEKFK